MSGDYSRITFDPLHDDLGVLLQQGRPLSDADWNALTLQLRRRIHAGTLDTIGVAVVPMQTPDGFGIAINGGNLEIGRGRIYVDGLLAENHGAGDMAWEPRLEELIGTQPVLYTSPDPELAQPYYPNAPALPFGDGPHLVYLDVWQREVTHVVRPELVEVAVGVDSTTRLQTVWQVKLLADAGADVSCSTPLDQFPELAPSGGRLSTTTLAVPVDPDPCLIPPGGGYKGLENQLYRIEIHAPGGLGVATFKMSRENASVETRITHIPALDRLVVESIGKDSVLRFNNGDWVEISDDWLELHNLPGELRRIGNVDDATRTISLEAPLTASLFPTGPGDVTQPGRHTRIKRWDHTGVVRDQDGNTLQDLDSAGSNGEITVPAGAGTGVLLELGIVATFALDPAGGAFRSGDYWVFAARSTDATIEELDRAPPRGIHHHYAKLGIVTLPDTFDDCRVFWPPPTVPSGGDHCACTVCVTPEQHASSQPSIQSAIDQVIAAGGGTVCLDVGVYELRTPLRIENAKSLRIIGKGDTSKLQSDGPVILIRDSVDVGLERFSARSRGGGAAIDNALSLGNMTDVRIAQPPARAYRDWRAVPLGRAAVGSVLSLRSSRKIRIERLKIRGDNDWSAVALSGALHDLAIRDNDIMAANGIVSDGATTADGTGMIDLRIEDNQFICQDVAVGLPGISLHGFVTRISGNRVLVCRDAGFILTGATLPGFTVEISSNDFRVLGEGIVAGISGLRIVDNDLVSGEPSVDRPRRGIVLTRGLTDDRGLDACEIVGNRIVGFLDAAIDIETSLPLLASAIIKQNQIEDVGEGVRCLKTALRKLTIDNNQCSRIRDYGIRIESIAVGKNAQISASGNQLDILERKPAVMIHFDSGDCLFTGNHCVQPQVEKACVQLSADSLVVASNRVMHKGGLSMLLTCDGTRERPHCTVLGNITMGAIRISASGVDFPLPDPWKPLNLQNT